MKYSFVAALFLLLVLSVSSSALTWSEALSIAEKNNNDLLSAQKQLESYQWSYRRAQTSFLPQLSASASLTESGTTAARSYSYGLSATQSLFKGGDNLFNLQSAQADLDYQRASYQSTVAEVYYEIRSAFVDLLTSQDNIVLLERILEQRQENARLVKLLYESGKEDKGNLMLTQADLEQAEYDLASAKRDLKLVQLKISQLLDEQIEAVSGQRELSFSKKSNLEELVSACPGYNLAKYKLEGAEIAYKATLSGFLPSVSLSGSSRSSGASWPPTSNSTSWSLNVSYSLFPGGSNFVDRALYATKLDQAKTDYSQSIKDARYSINEAYQDYKDALEVLGVRETYFEATEERAKIARVKYLNGLITYDDWDRTESAYITAQKSLLTARKTTLLAEAGWYKSYGGYVK